MSETIYEWTDEHGYHGTIATEGDPAGSRLEVGVGKDSDSLVWVCVTFEQALVLAEALLKWTKPAQEQPMCQTCTPTRGAIGDVWFHDVRCLMARNEAQHAANEEAKPEAMALYNLANRQPEPMKTQILQVADEIRKAANEEAKPEDIVESDPITGRVKLNIKELQGYPSRIERLESDIELLLTQVRDNLPPLLDDIQSRIKALEDELGRRVDTLEHRADGNTTQRDGIYDRIKALEDKG